MKIQFIDGILHAIPESDLRQESKSGGDENARHTGAQRSVLGFDTEESRDTNGIKNQ
jgi:hypothetical protein